MIIEIRKAGFTNKGAELMLYATLQKIKERYPNSTLVMAPTHSKSAQPFSKLTRLGFYPKAWLWRYGIQWGDFASILPKKMQEMYGLILDKDIDVVLDAAGFSYSDQWGTLDSKELARSSKRWKKNNTKLILLPQALGPYRNPQILPYVREFAKNADLIFAREDDSYKHLVDVVGEQPKIKLSPDFTNLVKGELPASFDRLKCRVALIPNYRMMDKTSLEISEAYLPFMIKCAKYLIQTDAHPFILVHERDNDEALAKKISKAAGGIPIINEQDPLKIKGIIGACDATIGSRFHGLVSALSQGVPSLATGWSHKYQKLFEDYDFPEGIASVHYEEHLIKSKIDLILNESTAPELKSRLTNKSQELKALSERMWREVFLVMDSKINNRN